MNKSEDSFLLDASQFTGSPQGASADAAESPSSSITRRKFLKRTGGATMGTIVIATLGTQRAYADWDSYWSRVKEELSDSFFPDPPPSIYEEITEALTEMVECTHPEWEKEPEVQTQYYIYGTKTCKACGLQTPYSDPLPGVA